MTTTLQQYPDGSYLTTFFDEFVVRKLNSLHFIPREITTINAALKIAGDEEKRGKLGEISIALEDYRNTNHQWISDKDDAILEEIDCLLREAIMPVIEVPTRGRHKLYYDLLHLKEVFDVLTTELHCDDISYFVKEMGRCIPHSAIQYVLLLKMGQFKLYYNRLKCLASRLAKCELDGGQPEYDAKSVILTAYSRVEMVGDEEPLEIPDERGKFIELWRAKTYDNQALLYPLQKMYRNMPYSKTETDDWLFAHREQLKYMNGDAFWLRSLAYAQLEASIRFAFYHYPSVSSGAPWGWDFDPISVYPLSFSVPNSIFKKYYDKMVAEFCVWVDTSNTNRTDAYLKDIFTLASKIRVMSEWMKNGIDGIEIDGGFIMLAVLTPPDAPDMSNNLSVSYCKMIDYLAYSICTGECSAQTLYMLKLCNAMVNENEPTPLADCKPAVQTKNNLLMKRGVTYCNYTL